MSREERIDRIKSLPAECIDDILMYADFVERRERAKNTVGKQNLDSLFALAGKMHLDGEAVMRDRLESMT